MTKIKLCGLSRQEDIAAANRLMPEYTGFVFAKKSRRYVSPEKAAPLRAGLSGNISAVGVFVDEDIEAVASLAENGVIDIIQLHGSEGDEYISSLRRLTDKPVIKAFVINSAQDAAKAESSSADMVLLDGGTGCGSTFDWDLLRDFGRPFFLAGGLSPENVSDAIRYLHPYAVDVSSGIETNGIKDYNKMKAFTDAVRKEEKK